jgi:hypothetical protein
MTLSVCLDTQVHHLCYNNGCCQISTIADAPFDADCSDLTASPGQKRATPYHIGSNRMTLSVCLDTQVHHLMPQRQMLLSKIADVQLEADCSGLTASPGQKRAMPYHNH